MLEEMRENCDRIFKRRKNCQYAWHSWRSPRHLTNGLSRRTLQERCQIDPFCEGKQPLVLVIANHRKHKNFDLLTFEGYPNINDVEVFRNGILKVAEEDLTDLEENEFYYYEIIGLPVIDENGQVLGKIKEILSPGANDVWVVQRKGQKDALIPYIESVVKRIDLENEEIHVEIPEGLLDDAD